MMTAKAALFEPFLPEVLMLGNTFLNLETE